MKFIAFLLPLAMLAACTVPGANPEDQAAPPGILAGKLPPGTASPSAKTGIVRYEALDTSNGNGFAQDFTYNAANDTFSIDNLGFDGGNSYTRGAAISSLGPFAVYDGPNIFPDTVTGTPISQLLHRAIYGVSASGQTQLAIVRTGSYIDYGFGGFTYQRSGGTVLPTSGQAAFTGAYAGMRDFNGASGLEFVTGDMDMDIDFNDFNNGNAVKGVVYNRQIFDPSGTDITDTVIAAVSRDTGLTHTILPMLTFRIGPGVMDANGEMTGGVNAFASNDLGGVNDYGKGTYYAVLSGDITQGGEVVGIIIVEADDPRASGVVVRETGGFLLSRQ